MKHNQKSSADESVRQSRYFEMWKQFRRNTGAMIGLAVTIILVIIAIFADVIWDYESEVIRMSIRDRLIRPCMEHPFGTDEYGRDMLARVAYGTRYSLVIGISSVLLGLCIGAPLGATSGYIGGKYDTIVMRLVDTFSIIPSILMTVILVTILGKSFVNLIIALAVSTIPIIARVTRAAVITIRNNEYIESARAVGASDLYCIFRYVIPNCYSTILVQSTLRIGTTIISASSLSYIGLGVSLPTPEWGALLNAAKSFIVDAPYLCLYPGLAIMITVMAINLVGDGLRDALDPKLKR